MRPTRSLAPLLLLALPGGCATGPILHALRNQPGALTVEPAAEHTAWRTPEGEWHLQVRYAAGSRRTLRWALAAGAPEPVRVDPGHLPPPAGAEPVAVVVGGPPPDEGVWLLAPDTVVLRRGGACVRRERVPGLFVLRRWPSRGVALGLLLPLTLAWDLVTWPVVLVAPGLWLHWNGLWGLPW